MVFIHRQRIAQRHAGWRHGVNIDDQCGRGIGHAVDGHGKSVCAVRQRRCRRIAAPVQGDLDAILKKMDGSISRHVDSGRAVLGNSVANHGAITGGIQGGRGGGVVGIDGHCQSA